MAAFLNLSPINAAEEDSSGRFCQDDVVSPLLLLTFAVTGPIVFEWTVTAAPVGATVSFSNPGAAFSRVTVDRPGNYVIRACAFGETRCECAEMTLTFFCEEDELCDEEIISITWKNCDFEARELVSGIEIPLPEGSPMPEYTCPDEFLVDCGDCEDQRCSRPHRPVFFYRDVCALGWTLEAEGLDEGSNIYDMCSCNMGQSIEFTGRLVIRGQGDPMLINTVMIWGHNMVDATVSTFPAGPFGGNPTNVGVTSDNSGLGGYLTPVIINWADAPESTGEFEIIIESNNDDPICINQISVGSKFFLPRDELSEGFVNPHDGLDQEAEQILSDCGPLSRFLVRKPITVPLPILDVSTKWLKTEWRPFLRYISRYGLQFQWSREQCPGDVFNGWVKGVQQGSSFDTCDNQSITLIMEGYITQPEVKRYVRPE